MGRFKPGAAYVYEKADGVTYAREFGSNDRRVIGWDFNYRESQDPGTEKGLWDDIFEQAKSNPALRHALDQCKIVYYLSKEHGT